VRIGILGGTFDPPHNGHLLAAGDAFESLALDRVLFIPAAVQPLKTGLDTAPAADRFAMVERLIDGDLRFTASAMEIERGGLSYTVDTLSALAATWPGSTLFWLVGADVLQTFAKWREPERVVELATLAVLTRGGDPPDLGTIPGTPVVVEGRRIDISSTEIRRRVHEGKSIRGFVPDSVDAYIASARLYR
jgi:nicotinate-nucleotide adenylyltransferase